MSKDEFYKRFTFSDEEIEKIVLEGLIKEIWSKEHEFIIKEWMKKAEIKAKTIMDNYDTRDIRKCFAIVFGSRITYRGEYLDIKEGFEKIDEEKRLEKEWDEIRKKMEVCHKRMSNSNENHPEVVTED